MNKMKFDMDKIFMNRISNEAIVMSWLMSDNYFERFYRDYLLVKIRRKSRGRITRFYEIINRRFYLNAMNNRTD